MILVIFEQIGYEYVIVTMTSLRQVSGVTVKEVDSVQLEPLDCSQPQVAYGLTTLGKTRE